SPFFLSYQTATSIAAHIANALAIIAIMGISYFTAQKIITDTNTHAAYLAIVGTLIIALTHLHSLINRRPQAGYIADNHIARELYVADGVVWIGQPVYAVSVCYHVAFAVIFSKCFFYLLG